MDRHRPRGRGISTAADHLTSVQLLLQESKCGKLSDHLRRGDPEVAKMDGSGPLTRMRWFGITAAFTHSTHFPHPWRSTLRTASPVELQRSMLHTPER